MGNDIKKAIIGGCLVNGFAIFITGEISPNPKGIKTINVSAIFLICKFDYKDIIIIQR